MQPHEYLNTTVFAKLAPSPIQGIGVFAIRDIPKGIKISDYTLAERDNAHFYVMPVEQFELILPEIRELILDRMLFEDKPMVAFVSPNTDAQLRSFMNHSDDANTDGTVTLRDIQKGEELTENFKALTQTLHPLTKNHMKFLCL